MTTTAGLERGRRRSVSNPGAAPICTAPATGATSAIGRPRHRNFPIAKMERPHGDGAVGRYGEGPSPSECGLASDAIMQPPVSDVLPSRTRLLRRRFAAETRQTSRPRRFRPRRPRGSESAAPARQRGRPLSTKFPPSRRRRAPPTDRRTFDLASEGAAYQLFSNFRTVASTRGQFLGSIALRNFSEQLGHRSAMISLVGESFSLRLRWCATHPSSMKSMFDGSLSA